MPHPRATALLVLALVAGACGDSSTSTTSSTAPPTTIPAEVTPGDLTVTADGSDWTVPAAVCLGADGDAAAVGVAALAEGQEIHRLVAAASSGWPTTTMAPDFGVAFEEGMSLHGPLALALGDRGGVTDEILADWIALEAGYADSGYDPPTHVEMRLDGWRATAAAIEAAIDAACA